MRRRPLRLAGMTIPAGPLPLLPSRRGSGARYGTLLLILVVTYLLSAFTVANLVSAVQVLLFLAVVLIALRNGRFRRGTVRFVAVGLLLGSGISAVLQVVDHNGYGAALASLWTALILLLAVFLILRQVLTQPEITQQSIFGVLSAYMMIGLIFSAVFIAIWKFAGQPFFTQVASDDTNTKQFQYFSFATLTTLGYGDFTAAGDGGRAFAVLEAMIGQMFLATLVARLVAGLRWSARASARSSQDPAPAHPAAEGDGTSADGNPGGYRPAMAPSRTRGSAPGTPSPGRSRAKTVSAPGLVRLSPPGAVRGRRPGLRRGGRNGAGGSGPVPAARPTEPS